MIYETGLETNSHKGYGNKKEQRLLLFSLSWLSMNHGLGIAVRHSNQLSSA
jgi:hypothetical protein